MTAFALIYFFFFFNDTATTEIYTLSLHDALPISGSRITSHAGASFRNSRAKRSSRWLSYRRGARSEEHTSELQSQSNLVCRLLLEKKNKYKHEMHSVHSLRVRRSHARRYVPRSET